MDPCSSLSNFTRVKKVRTSESDLKGKKTNRLTAANTSHNNCMKNEFF